MRIRFVLSAVLDHGQAAGDRCGEDRIRRQDHWTNEVKPAGLYSGSDDDADLAGRETADAKLLTGALAAEQGKGSTPLAPAVRNVPVQVATRHCSGTFYDDLTSGSNSALESAVWNWAEYQYDTRTAGDTTGHHPTFSAELQRLDSGK